MKRQLRYYSFGMLMQERSYSSPAYRYGFNGKEKNDEINVEGGDYDFGARIYDSRLGRWLSLDPLMTKYASLSPYIFAGGSPIVFVDYGGKNFGVNIDNEKKTIEIVANVYTVSEQTRLQAQAGANLWNAKTTTIDGYTVTFKINVIPPKVLTTEELQSEYPKVNFYKENGDLDKDKIEQYSVKYNKRIVSGLSENDEIGNLYLGTSSVNSKVVEELDGESVVRYKGGLTVNGSKIAMNTVKRTDEKGFIEYEDLGDRAELVGHEIGHTLGLNDNEGGGIMVYGLKVKPISDNDVKNVIKYAKDKLAVNTDAQNGTVDSPGSAKVKVLSKTGKSDGSNPVGIKVE
jgi:RHS repeat-associated protein